MLIWEAASVADEPSTTLVRWQVMQFADGSRSFVGYAVESREGRLSSAVRTFDARSLRGVTKTGRVYQLIGRPGVDADAAYLWNHYVAGHEKSEWADVTAAIWSEHETALEADESPVTSASGADAGANHA